MRVNFFEPVFINFYRKEYVLPDLKIDDLWRIYFYDGEYCKLQSRKKALRTLFEQCQKYQQETICANLDAEIPKDVRLVKVRYFFLNTRCTLLINGDWGRILKIYFMRNVNHCIT